jgi:putative Mg2+ transporter-C (MgtC) family protein
MTWAELVRADYWSADLDQIAIKLVAAAVLGGVIGLDREITDRPAGLRTHMLTALAAATFTVLTFEIAQMASQFERPNSDPIRVIEAVTAGVAFLAAGTIIRTGGQVEGLTTGAGMWMAGAVGIACGAGRLVLALAGTVIAAIILVALRWVERAIADSRETAPDQGESRGPPDPTGGDSPKRRP